jgi:hypothetical protein
LSHQLVLDYHNRGILSPRNPRSFSRQSRYLSLSLAVSFFLLVLLEGISYPAEVEPCLLPKDYGEVVCRYNEKSPNHLYIIGISHRDTLTGSNGPRTSRVQAEVYKIGEWLFKNRRVELLLPEGFFVEKPDRTSEKKAHGGSPATPPGTVNMEFLERRFSEESAFINAEMLLRQDFSLLLKQVEDRDIYQTVYENIRLLADSKSNLEKNFLVRSELDYHQKKRVGAMLQKIPGIVNEEFRDGHIDNKKALFTIGLSHISSIINYLENRKITILSPLFTQVKYEDYVDELNLEKENFGISIIIPRTVIDDHEEMERNKLKVF